MKKETSIKVSGRKSLFDLHGTFWQIRTSGVSFAKDKSDARRLIFSNLIWVATYAGFILYTTGQAIFGGMPQGPFWTGVMGANLLFFIYLLLTRNGYIYFARHWLIISTYVVVAYFDNLSGANTFLFMCMFAFVPTPFNVFSWITSKFYILLYCVFPLAYAVCSQIYDISFFNTAFTPRQLEFHKTFNLSLSFLLIITFGSYMVFHSVAKQKKLTLQRFALQSTLDHSDSAIWSIDNNYNLIAANSLYIDSIENIFGISGVREGVNIKNHELWKKIPPVFKQQYNDVFSGKNILSEAKVDGDIYEIKGVPILDNQNNVLGGTFVSRNITAKKMAEETLLRAKKLAEDAGNAKARFVNNMSHELRTPLNGIIGITRILQDEKKLPQQEEHFTTLQDLTEHTLQIVNNVLDFAKIEAGKATLDCKRFNLSRFLKKISSIFLATTKLKGLKFETCESGSTDIYVKGDEVRLSQVLINLIGNAVKFTESGGVKLTCSVTKESENIIEVTFAVTDTGIGIKEESIAKIFESFSQADANTTRKFGGTGLGLSIAEKILSLMGGRLKVESRYGKGSSFSFDILLPLSSKIEMAAEVIHRASPVMNDLAGLTILIAEDNRVNQIVATKVLEKMNAKVAVVSNGKEAAEYNDIDKLSIILMDLDMPVMDGYESANLIKKMHPSTPIIALTAASFDDMHSFLAVKGFDGVVQKPFVPEELFSKISSIITKQAS